MADDNFLLNFKFAGNPIRQLASGTKVPADKPRLSSFKNSNKNHLKNAAVNVLLSWPNKFVYKEEKGDEKGLRSPQIGALHAVLAHWKVSNNPATVVIPTGLGKTETMLALTVCEQLEKLLIIVPTDALRDQITNKFLELGLLKKVGVVDTTALNPVVGTIHHGIKTVTEAKTFFDYCNVVVATMSAINSSSDEVKKAFASKTTHLFIDEAHHVTAPTWKKFIKLFENKPITQFTATPYRNDGKLVEGKIVFNFPLSQAHKLGYFRTINYDPVLEYDPEKADQTIADKAVNQLKKDLNAGYDHILMARVSSKKRAQRVLDLYKKHPEYKPVMIHTGITPKSERERIRQQIISKDSKIVVCVDMLGEGFDLPELKVAAFHDIRKSLPVTLQLVGRFTRARSDLGDPTFIANAANVDVSDELRELYAQNSDWNSLLSHTSEKATQEQVDLWEFLEGFDNIPQELPLQNIKPAMSTVVYKTRADNWHPENWEEGFNGIKLDKQIADINQKENTLVIITARKTNIGWGDIKAIYNWNWDLYIIHWSKDQNLLFINSSNNQGKFQNLAKAIAGQSAELVNEYRVFRSFAGINRLVLQNVGLLEQLGKLIRYTMRSGSDVEAGLTEADMRAVKKALVFGVGYEGGGKTSVGCSYKGRIWSRRVTNLEHLVKWFRHVGTKILDESIDPDEVLKGTLIPTPISVRPNKMPITVDWPEIIYTEPESIFELEIDGSRVPLVDCDIKLKNPSPRGDIVFDVGNDQFSVDCKLSLKQNNYEFRVIGSHTASIHYRSNSIKLTDFFFENTPRIWFFDNSLLEGNSYTELKSPAPPYSSQKIEIWDWNGVNLKKESQGIEMANDSIQFRVIEELKKQNYDVIFDDDGAGEIGDVLAIRDNGESLELDIYHCKYSSEEQPGARVADLYEVCGQAQKCISWLEKVEDIFRHIQTRDVRRVANSGVSRFMLGNRELIASYQIKIMRCPVKLAVKIVQPGLSVKAISESQLNLLSVTENYLMDTYKIPFTAIANK